MSAETPGEAERIGDPQIHSSTVNAFESSSILAERSDGDSKVESLLASLTITSCWCSFRMRSPAPGTERHCPSTSSSVCRERTQASAIAPSALTHPPGKSSSARQSRSG